MITRDQRLRQLIREYRVLRGLSQGEVARRIGANIATYQRLEAGVGRQTKRIAKICDVLGVSYAALMREAGFKAMKEDEKQ